MADATSLAALNDLTVAWNQMALLPCDAVLGVTMGNGQVLTAKTYCAGGASTINGTMTFDAQGDPNAIFIVKIDGALNAAAATQIVLANLAQAGNIYWRINGAVSILDNSTFKGTIVSNGAIHMYDGTSLDGRALAIVGAVTMASNVMSVSVVPPSSLTVTRPAGGDTLIGGTQNYQIGFTGINVTLRKTVEYSLNGGTTWNLISVIRSTATTVPWTVPTMGTKLALVRITDSNGVRGTSGMFTIVPSGSITVTRPAAGDTLIAGTQNYPILFTGVNIAPKKTFAYSLDSGATWIPIGTANNTSGSYAWNVPTTPSGRALVRITDSNGLVGTSGMFRIATAATTVGSITVLRPAAGDKIVAGTQGYQIAYVGVNLAQKKTFEYSLDSGATWQTIGVDRSNAAFYSWNVPTTPSARALVRITDSNGVRGVSGMFAITAKPDPGTITVVRPAAGDTLVAGTPNYQIGFIAINTSQKKLFEYSLDGGATWDSIGTGHTDAAFYSWTITERTSNRALVRITDSNGIRGTSGMFVIRMPSVREGSINSLTLGGVMDNQIGWSTPIYVSWTYTPDIGTSVDVEYSLDSGATWSKIATVPTGGPQIATWRTPSSGYYSAAMIRVTSTLGMRRVSAPFRIGTVAAVRDRASANGFSIGNYPNPLGNATTIRFVLPASGFASVTVVDGLGRVVGTVAGGAFEAGSHEIQFDASGLSSGVYTYTLEAGKTRVSGTMTVVK